MNNLNVNISKMNNKYNLIMMKQSGFISGAVSEGSFNPSFSSSKKKETEYKKKAVQRITVLINY